MSLIFYSLEIKAVLVGATAKCQQSLAAKYLLYFLQLSQNVQEWLITE